MRPYKQITETERRVIQKMHYSGVKPQEIAHSLQRHPSTIIRELKRNKTRGYNAGEAQEKSQARRYRKARILYSDGFLRMLIVDFLMEKNSPEVIAFYLRKYFPFCRISHEAIYQWLYDRSPAGGYAFSRLLFTKKRIRQKRGNTYKTRGKDTFKKNIRERPKEAEDRSECGHLEGDLIVGKGNSGYLITLVDRKIDFLWSLKIPSKDEETTLRGFIEINEDIEKGYIKTITLDNGTEFNLYPLLEKALSCKVYFADPYSSYQRGLNEHHNARLRQYFPKDFSFSGLTDDMVGNAVSDINNRPRKSLGWVSPSELYRSASVALSH